MKTRLNIIIKEAPADLAKYTHSAPASSAEYLAEAIADLENAGFTVIYARGQKPSVPTCYRSAYKMHAPVYVFRPAARIIEMIDSKLETRSRGATIPAVFEVEGSIVPPGFRCFERGETFLIIRAK